MARYLKFATTSTFKLITAILLMFTAGVEIGHDIVHGVEHGWIVGVHHGVFVLGFATFLQSLADLGENTSLLMEATTDIAETKE